MIYYDDGYECYFHFQQKQEESIIRKQKSYVGLFDAFPDPNDVRQHEEQTQYEHNAEVKKLLHIAESFYSDRKNEKRLEDSEEDWKLVAMVLDRLFLYIFIILCILLSVVILTRTGPYGKEMALLNVF